MKIDVYWGRTFGGSQPIGHADTWNKAMDLAIGFLEPRFPRMSLDTFSFNPITPSRYAWQIDYGSHRNFIFFDSDERIGF